MNRASFIIAVIGLLLGALRLSAASKASNADVLAAVAKVSEALASDDFAGAKSAATALAPIAESAKNAALASSAKAVAAASDLAGARKEFKTLSAEAEKLADGVEGYTVMHCPMAKGDWVQTTGPTRNPYYGKAVLGCGGPKNKGHSGMHGM